MLRDTAKPGARLMTGAMEALTRRKERCPSCKVGSVVDLWLPPHNVDGNRCEQSGNWDIKTPWSNHELVADVQFAKCTFNSEKLGLTLSSRCQSDS